PFGVPSDTRRAAHPRPVASPGSLGAVVPQARAMLDQGRGGLPARGNTNSTPAPPSIPASPLRLLFHSATRRANATREAGAAPVSWSTAPPTAPAPPPAPTPKPAASPDPSANTAGKWPPGSRALYRGPSAAA